MPLPDWWKRPEIKKVQPMGVTGDLVALRIELKPPIPSEDWFKHHFDYQGTPQLGRAPTLSNPDTMGRTVLQGACRDKFFDEYVDAVETAIGVANERFEQKDIPLIEKWEEEGRAQRQSDEQRLEGIKRRAQERFPDDG